MRLKYLLIVMYVLVSGDVKVFAVSAEYSPGEQECFYLGGRCAKAQECVFKVRLENNKELCDDGSVCCSYAPGSNNCHLNGGECFAKGMKCADLLTVKGVTDCDEGGTCCILVK